MDHSIKRFLSVLLSAALALTAVSAAFAARQSAGQTAGVLRGRNAATATDATATDALSAAAKTENGLTYIVSNGQAVVIAADASVKGEVVIPDTLGGAPVGIIGMGAFKGNTAITAITLPDSVAAVDEQAFAGCAALARIDCGESLESLPESAYAGCEKLGKNIRFAKNSEFFPIEKNVVYNKDKTELISVSDGFSGVLTVPETVTYVRAGAFRDCAGLTEVVFTNPATEIGAYAFAGCVKLTKAELPAKLSAIREGTFSGCTALNDVTIPGGLTAIGDGAFENCAIREFIVPINCANVGKAAFSGCASLAKVTFLCSLTALPDGLFAGCTALKDLKLPEGVTAVGEKTFYNCAALEDVGDVLKYRQFGRDAFTGSGWYAKQSDAAYYAGDTLLFWKGICDKVVDLSGKKITAIAPGAFSGCDTLMMITLPDGLTSIGAAAFENCTALATVSFDGVAKIGPGAFDGTAFLASADGAELYLGANLIRAAAATAPATATPTDATATDATATDAAADGKVYTVLQNVKSIAGGAFADADPAIERIVLPEGLVIVSDGAFDGLKNLKTVNEPDSLEYFGWKPAEPACGHENTVVKYADAEVCARAYFTGCTYCADCAALLDPGALREAAGHRFTVVRQEADPTLGEVVVVIECGVCKEQRRVPLSEYNVRFIDNDKAAADGDYVIIAPDAAMADVLKGCPEGTLVLNAAGERLADDVAPGSGMRLLFPSARSYTVILFGDADGDGKISPSDARIALRRSVNLEEKLDWRDKACHVICDGKTAVTPEDARMILRASVRLEDPARLGRKPDAPVATDTDATPTDATPTDAPPATPTDPEPTSEPTSEPAVKPAPKPGKYVCAEPAGVYLRVYHSRTYSVVDIIRYGENVTVTEVFCDTSTGENVYWGKIDHSGAVGWSMLEYYEAK